MKEIEIIIEEMSLEEKSELCMGKTKWSTKDFTHYGIPEVLMTDGTNGVRWNKTTKEIEEEGKEELSFFDVTDLSQDSRRIDYIHPSTCYPSGSAIACSWDRDLASKVGDAVAAECRQFGVSLLLGPGLNIRRHPLGGRGFEYFSEDPFLSGEMAAAFVRGVQKRGVGTTVKHFVCNNSEFQRTKMSSEVDERAFREIYLAGFERVVRQAKPWAVMSSYNKIRGEQAAEYKTLLNDILRVEWGFEGFVVSDWWAIKDRVKSALAGNDLEMPVNPKHVHILANAVRSGQLDSRVLDTMCRNILTFVRKAVESNTIQKGPAVNTEEHHRLARKAAAESAVLLKNANYTLPIDRSRVRKIAVVGDIALMPRYQGGGCALIHPTKLEIPLDEIRKAAGDSTKVVFSQGYNRNDTTTDDLLSAARKTAAEADIAVVFAGLKIAADMEGCDRTHLEIEQAHIDLINAVASVQSRTAVVLNNGDAVTMSPWIEKVGAVLEVFFGGQAGASAIADILFGDVNPSGKLTVTFPKRLEDTPAYLHYPGENGRHLYSEGICAGYRYYDYRKIELLFPFGHGLSYTEFTYSDLVLPKGPQRETDTIQVSLSVKNTGQKPGKEIVQIYIEPPISRLSRPVKELKGFTKIELDPNEEKQVTMVLQRRDFAYYDPAFSDWLVESGDYGILVGASSRDIRLKGSVSIRAEKQRFPLVTFETLHVELFSNEKAKQLYLDFLVSKGIVRREEIDDAFIAVLEGNFVGIKNCLSSMFQSDIPDEELQALLDDINSKSA